MSFNVNLGNERMNDDDDGGGGCCPDCCCCALLRSDWIPVPFDMMSDKAGMRFLPLGVATFVSVTFASWMSYYVLLVTTVDLPSCPQYFGVDPNRYLAAIEQSYFVDASLISGAGYTTFGSAAVTAAVYGMANSTWQGRWWILLAVPIAIAKFLLSILNVRACTFFGTEDVAASPVTSVAMISCILDGTVVLLFAVIVYDLFVKMRTAGPDSTCCRVWCRAERFEADAEAEQKLRIARIGKVRDERSLWTYLRHSVREALAVLRRAAIAVGKDLASSHRWPTRIMIAFVLSLLVVFVMTWVTIAIGVASNKWLQTTGHDVAVQTKAARIAVQALPELLRANLGWLTNALLALEDFIPEFIGTASHVRSAAISGAVAALANDLMWKLRMISAVACSVDAAAARATAAIDPSHVFLDEPKHRNIAQAEFYVSFYFVGVTACSSVLAFASIALVVGSLCLTVYDDRLRNYLWGSYLAIGYFSSLVFNWVFKKLFFNGILSNGRKIRFHRFFRLLDYVWSITLGPTSASASAILRFLLLIAWCLSSLARFDETSLPSAFALYDDGYAAWAATFKVESHYRVDVVVTSDGSGGSGDGGDAVSDEVGPRREVPGAEDADLRARLLITIGRKDGSVET